MVEQTDKGHFIMVLKIIVVIVNSFLNVMLFTDILVDCSRLLIF